MGVRVLDEGVWYGEGEVKLYRDGENALPTICGTGLEDYAGSAWGMGQHSALYAGAPLTCQFVLEDHAVRHSYHHLAVLRAAVNG